MVFRLFKFNKNSLDLYISNSELIRNGLTEKSKKEIADFSSEFEKEVKDITKTEIRKSLVKEKNYGMGADWTVAFVEFVARSDFLKAIATTGGLITFSKHIVTIFKKFMERKDPSILLGIRTAKFFAVKYISDEISVKNLKLVKSYELNRGETGFMDKEYLFIFSVNKVKINDVQNRFNREKKYTEEIFIVCIDWRGNLKSIKRF